MFNTRTNRLECPFCGIALKPFGGRFTPRFNTMPEVFLCVHCGHAVGMSEAINEALLTKAAIRRRYQNARREVEASQVITGHSDNRYTRYNVAAGNPVRQKLIELILTLLAEEAHVQ